MSAESETRVVCFGVESKVLDQLVRRAPVGEIATAASTDGADRPFTDATVHGLANSVRSVLREPNTCSRLFLEQITWAVAAHLLLRLDAAHARLGGGLAPWQLAKAKRLVSANLGRTLQAHELAGPAVCHPATSRGRSGARRGQARTLGGQPAGRSREASDAELGRAAG